MYFAPFSPLQYYASKRRFSLSLSLSLIASLSLKLLLMFDTTKESNPVNTDTHCYFRVKPPPFVYC